MATLNQEQLNAITQNINLNMSTVMGLFVLIGEVKKDDRSDIRNTRINQTLLACLVMALNTQNDLALAIADKSQILVPN